MFLPSWLYNNLKTFILLSSPLFQTPFVHGFLYMIFYYGPLRHVCKPFMQSIISHNQSCLECSYLADCTIISKLSSYSVQLSFQTPFVHGFLYMIFYYGSLRHVCKPFMQTIISHNKSCLECFYLADCTIISKLSSYSVHLSFKLPLSMGSFTWSFIMDHWDMYINPLSKL